MNLNQLNYFAVTARHQHFTRAAEELFISQPSLSYAISSLEEELGIRLFEKKGRNVVLTKYGRLFLRHVERALAEIEQGRAEIADLNNLCGGRIDAAYLTPATIGRIPYAIRQFTSTPENAEVRFTFVHGDAQALLDGLRSQKYDLLFCHGLPKEPDIGVVPLFHQALHAIVPLNHPLAQAERIAPEALAPYPLALYQQDGPDGQYCEALLRRYFSPNVVFRAADDPTLYRMVAAGCSLAVAIRAPELEFFPVRAIPIQGADFEFDIQLFYLDNRYLSPVVERFIAFARTYPWQMAEGV